MEPVNIIHSKSGTKATVHPFGATLTSFQTSSGHELIFVSKLAKTDGSKPIRGGIPLCYPQFGRPDESMPQHGFLRRNLWKLAEGSPVDNEEEAKCTFELRLSDVKEGREGGKWAEGATPGLDCVATYTVSISAGCLKTVLSISNTGSTSFEMQALLHTYYRVHGGKALDPDLCSVSGLEGYDVEDKITGDKYILPSDKLVTIDCEVDRIYTAPKDKDSLQLTVITGEGGSKVGLNAFAHMTPSGGGGTSTPISVSAVVWNPFIEKAKGMGDFDDEEYHDMICVEPGIIHNVPALEVGGVVTFTQVMNAM